MTRRTPGSRAAQTTRYLSGWCSPNTTGAFHCENLFSLDPSRTQSSGGASDRPQVGQDLHMADRTFQLWPVNVECLTHAFQRGSLPKTSSFSKAVSLTVVNWIKTFKSCRKFFVVRLLWCLFAGKNSWCSFLFDYLKKKKTCLLWPNTAHQFYLTLSGHVPQYVTSTHVCHIYINVMNYKKT